MYVIFRIYFRSIIRLVASNGNYVSTGVSTGNKSDDGSEIDSKYNAHISLLFDLYLKSQRW